jgi:uridine monophosphate synthetase
VTTLSDFIDRSARSHDSLLCVGLDPRTTTAADACRECFALIEATWDLAAAYKPNSAFFEVFGADGLAALRDVIAHAPPGTPVLLDAKRGDIGDTSEAYARAAFDTLGAHAMTVSPYLGSDSVAPFLRRAEKGAFILCKTSNPGADELQALECDGVAIYERVATLAAGWNRLNNVGLVVGATYPTALARVRAAAPDLWILLPGIGTQGGDLEAALAAGLRADGLGILVSASRSIAQASNPRAEALRLRDAINDCRRSPKSATVQAEGPLQISHAIKVLAADLVSTDCVRFGRFTMKSGRPTPIYLDLRRLVSRPTVLQRVARAYVEILRKLAYDRVAGIPYAALPIATAVSLLVDRPLIYSRREAKEYGTRAAIEGDFAPGDRIAVIDDLVTTGGTKIETINKLESAGLRVKDIVVLIDRDQGARVMLAAAGYDMHAVVTLPVLLDEWLRSGAITAEQHGEVDAYLKQPMTAE